MHSYMKYMYLGQSQNALYKHKCITLQSTNNNGTHRQSNVSSKKLKIIATYVNTQQTTGN